MMNKLISLVALAVTGSAYALDSSFNLSTSSPYPFVFQWFAPSYNYGTLAGFGNAGFTPGTQVDYYKDIAYQSNFWFRGSFPSTGAKDTREYQVVWYDIFPTYLASNKVAINSVEMVAGVKAALRFDFTYTLTSVAPNQGFVTIDYTVKNQLTTPGQNIDLELFPYEDLQTDPANPANDTVTYDPIQKLFTYSGSGPNKAYFRCTQGTPVSYEANQYLTLRGKLADGSVSYLTGGIAQNGQDMSTVFQLHQSLAPGEAKSGQVAIGFNMVPTVSNVATMVVTLADLATAPTGQPIAWLLVNPSTGAILDQGTSVEDVNGNISINTGYSGSADLLIKGGHWLQKRIPNVTIGSSTTLSPVSLINGDINGDNVVNINDYAELSDNFNTDNSSAFFDKRADLDENGAININDYSILSNNFNVAGDL